MNELKSEGFGTRIEVAVPFGEKRTRPGDIQVIDFTIGKTTNIDVAVVCPTAISNRIKAKKGVGNLLDKKEAAEFIRAIGNYNHKWRCGADVSDAG